MATPPATPDAVALAVLARAPVPGEAKTRLIPRLGPDGAAALHAALVRRTLETAAAARLGSVTLWGAPDAHHPFFAACREAFGVAVRAQPEGDLGRRMLAVFEAHAPAPVVLIGTDCPVLAPGHLRRAAADLAAGADAVFLPAEDGGYGLVGLRRPVPDLFRDMPWGGPAVMAHTRDRLRALGLTWTEPASVWDVDRPEDVDRLIDSRLMPEL